MLIVICRARKTRLPRIGLIRICWCGSPDSEVYKINPLETKRRKMKEKKKTKKGLGKDMKEKEYYFYNSLILTVGQGSYRCDPNNRIKKKKKEK